MILGTSPPQKDLGASPLNSLNPIVPYRTYKNHEGDSLSFGISIFPFLTIGISMYQKYMLPYFIIPYLFTPSFFPCKPSQTDRQTDRILHPLLPKFFFFPLSARGPTRRRNSTGLAELWGGWPIEPDIICADICRYLQISAQISGHASRYRFQ